MNTLLLLLMTMIPQGIPEFPYPEFDVKSYPETVMPGDVFYFMLVTKKPYAESIYISMFATGESAKINLKDSENQMQPLLFESLPMYIDVRLRFTEFKPGSHALLMWKINVPPLEDLKEPFWEKHLKNLSEKDEKLWFCGDIISYAATNEVGDSKDEMLSYTFEIPISMKRRPEKEMALIRKWYDETPEELFPKPDRREKPTKKFSPHRNLVVESENVLVQGKEITQRQFIRFGSRYPGYPNAPETWQGWKELEESLTPSTMRDEIRLTRILIQYCDTENDVVLKELKEWFSGMNEVQRTVIAKSIRDLARGAYDRKILPQFREIYHAVREYDVAPMPESEVKYLKDLGLIE